MTDAYELAFDAIKKSVKSTTQDPALYKTWFGQPYNNKVKLDYIDMRNAMRRTVYTLDCDPDECEDNYYAYTYKDSTTIFLCNQFFASDLTGTDSKLGTIVHELSHAVSCTEDHEYGQDDCKALAMNAPNMAVTNSDNYEYFSEAQNC